MNGRDDDKPRCANCVKNNNNNHNFRSLVHLCLPLCIFNYICTDFTAAFSVLNECTHKTHKTMAKTEANAYPKVGR